MMTTSSRFHLLWGSFAALHWESPHVCQKANSILQCFGVEWKRPWCYTHYVGSPHKDGRKFTLSEALNKPTSLLSREKHWDFLGSGLVQTLSRSPSYHCLDPLVFIQHRNRWKATCHSLNWCIYFPLNALYRFYVFDFISYSICIIIYCNLVQRKIVSSIFIAVMTRREIRCA